MAGANGEDVEEAAQERKRGLSGSMSLRTRKLGRRLSRSMSIVALKLPEKAQSITRSSSKLMRSGTRDKKNRAFDLSIILPDKTQKQAMVWGNATVAEVVCEPLQEAGAVLAGVPSGPLSAPVAVTLGGPLPSPTSLPAPSAPPAALLFLGGSKAPVDARAPASSLEGEVLVVEYQPPQWDGKDLDTFIAWEKIYASTLFSAVELYGKPLLRAAVITKEEYHLLFYYLESVSEASEALTERMRKYIDSGLLINEGKKQDDTVSVSSKKTDKGPEQKSILKELLQEGVLCQRDIDVSSEVTTSDFHEQSSESRKFDDNESIVSSVNTSLRKVIVDIPIDCNESVADSSIIETSDNVTTVTIRSSGQCCADHRISADASENVWATVRWDFLNPTDFGYDQVRSVQRSRSDSAITPLSRRRNEDIYERLRDEGESCGSITPYESIEDLYDCIKNAQYSSAAAEESSPSTESQSEPQFPDFFEKSSTIRQSSACSEKSGDSSVFPFSKCGSSDSAGAMTSCESTSGISTFASKSMPESLKCRELPPPPAEGDASESAILLKQLFSGELMDAYNEFLSAYPHARALLRRKARRDEHFTALADIRRGAAKYTIGDYLQLPFPRSQEEWKRIAALFEQRWNFPHLLGAMDGKHVTINPPRGSGSTYFNYKKKHSMVLMAIVDAQYQFILCDFGTNGRISDGGVLQNTTFFQKLQENDLNIPAEEIVTNSSKSLPYVFVADDAFPLRTDMMKPFRQAELDTREKKIYNYRVSRARRIVENCFGILATRFRIFHTDINVHPSRIESIVMACCALHNFLIKMLPNSYISPECFDREQTDIGHVTPGYDTNHSTMEPLQQRNIGNTARTPKMIRQEFMNYFNNEGQVPWQNNFI